MNTPFVLRRFLSVFVCIVIAGIASVHIAHASSASSSAPQQKIPILVYHHIRSTKSYPQSTWSYKMSVSPDIFRKQMEWIRQHGYTTINLDTYVSIMRGDIAGPAKPIVITFDDNNLTQYTLAAPILREQSHIAVFYLVTNRLKNKSFITEDQVKQLAEWGMDIQSHTLDHATLTHLSLKRLDEEFVQSKAVLEALTGKAVRHVAYPSTAHNKTVRERASNAGFVTGTIMDPRPATSKDDLLRLPRIQMNDTTKLATLLP